MNEYPVPHGAEQRAKQLNIEATNRLIHILKDEASNDLPVIRSDIDFNPDDITLGYDGSPILELEEIPAPRNLSDPDRQIAFKVGIHPDGFSKISMIERLNGGCVGRLNFILRQEEVTEAYGHRSGGGESTFISKTDGVPVDSDTLDYLISTLPLAFENKRQNIIRTQKKSTLLGRASLGITDWLENRRAAKEGNQQPSIGS